MSAYAETQFENKAICLSLGEGNEHRSSDGGAKNNDKCDGMKASLHFDADDDLGFAAFFPAEEKRRVARTERHEFCQRISSHVYRSNSDQNLDWTPE